MSSPLIVPQASPEPINSNIQALERDITEWAVWFNQNKDNDRSMEMEVAFLKRALDGAMACVVRTCVELKALREGKREEYHHLLRPELFN